jgi:peptidoglycan/LPS O-acetylase OafA/YrhL
MSLMVSVLPTSKPPGRMQLLDTFRFVAAAAVIAYHFFYSGIGTGAVSTVTFTAAADIASYGYLGVHLFFMISGFVIAASAHGRSASEFAVRRLVRLYPAFWAAVAFTAFITAVWGGSAYAVSLPQVLANLTMMPGIFDQPLIDASYWTLFHELLFYGMVFLFLLAGKGHWLEAFFPGWALVMVVVSVVAPALSTVPFMGTLYGFFAAGAIISTIQRRGWGWWQGIGLASTLYVVIAYTIENVRSINLSNGQFEQSTAVTVAVICGFFALLLIQIMPRASSWTIPKSRLLGSLTYPVYLVHTQFGYVMLNAFATDSNKWLVYPLILGAILAMAYLLHVVIERRLKRFWFRFFDKAAGNPIRRFEHLLGRANTATRLARS